jgi:glycine/D-amino acid oxidase-like deaminating enzyme
MRMHVVVVGAGAVGAAVALRLAQRGARVVVVDRGEPGSGTTSTSFAWIGASAAALRDYRALNVAGVEAWARLQADLGPRSWLHRTGSLVWHTDTKRAAELAAGVGALQDAGYAATLLEPDRAVALEPSLRLPPSVEHVAFHADEGHVDGRRMAAELIARAADAGAELRTGVEVTAVEPDAPAAVLATGEPLTADAVVLCTGRWTSRLADLAMLDAQERGALPIGLLVTTGAVPDPVGRVVIADDVMIRPGDDGGLLLHADEQDRLVHPEDGEARIAEVAAQVLDAARPHVVVPEAMRVAHAVVGLRALTADLLPAAGWLSDGVYAAVTHSGMTLAPALGELVAAEVLGRTQEPLLAPFRPDRLTRRT